MENWHCAGFPPFFFLNIKLPFWDIDGATQEFEPSILRGEYTYIYIYTYMLSNIVNMFSNIVNVLYYYGTHIYIYIVLNIYIYNYICI